MAGYAAMVSDDVLSPEEIDGMIDSIDFSDEMEVVHEKDEGDCLEHLLQLIVRNQDLEVLGQGTSQSMRNLMMLAKLNNVAADILSLYGMKINGEFLAIMHKHPELNKLFANTKWYTGWRKQLERIEGVEKSRVIRFGNTTARCIMVPLQHIFT